MSRADKGQEVRQIYVRAMDSSEAAPIPGTEGAIAPFFSPDGQWLGFFADGKLKKIAVAGGAPRTLADVTNSFGATWIADHTIAFVPLGSAIQQIPDEGGEPVHLTTMLPGEVVHAWPGRLPGGRGVLFAASTAKDLFISAQPLGTGDRKDFKGQFGMMPRYVMSGHMVYGQNGTLMAVPFESTGDGRQPGQAGDSGGQRHLARARFRGAVQRLGPMGHWRMSWVPLRPRRTVSCGSAEPESSSR